MSNKIFLTEGRMPVNRDLLTAPVRPLILRIALPSMGAMIASSLGALLDTLLLGRSHAQLSAAVSVSFSLLTLIQTLGFTLGMGAGSFVSRCIGRSNKPDAYAAASTALFAALAISLPLCAAGLFFLRPLVSMLGAEGELIDPAARYARYVLLSAPLLCVSLMLSSLLRAQGKTLPNLLAFAGGAAAGVGLELLLTPRLGVHGAGAAMLVRESSTLILLAGSMIKEKRLVRPRLRAVCFRLSVYRNIMRSGLPTLLRQGLMSVSSVLLTRAAAAFGESILAGVGLAVRVASLVSSAVIGFGQGFQPVCGAAFGAGNTERVRQAYRFCLRAAMLALAFAGAAVFVFARRLLAPFDPGGSALDIAVRALRAQSAVFFAQGAVIMMNMLTQAMGLPVRASIIATSRQGFVFIPLILLLPRLFGESGLILCQSASDLVSLALCFLLVRGILTDCACARGGCSDAQTASR